MLGSSTLYCLGCRQLAAGSIFLDDMPKLDDANVGGHSAWVRTTQPAALQSVNSMPQAEQGDDARRELRRPASRWPARTS